ncbi:C69 family dipeptidase [Photobacterium damselae subsp. damselae]|uniref:C69 family dipeptidase n=1 Tax=Photobacterium damselae TaxID=38293 RepID=UPI00083B310E|nr:C69 family dipeptidase [Photobacterium damselae]KAB1183968.1 C69 family dipeptidase [Photobacterium damselae subsp. damselae]MBF7098836.1 C69 family dipeptidase [Photobacterium damselae]QSH58826.1 C69 family dipeptidase [Photobacterium damselae subsp. damselae]
MKKLTLLASSIIAATIAGQASACTTILVGNQATKDGSYIVARNEDYQATNAKNFVFHPAEKPQKEAFHSNANDFTYPAAKEALQYTSMSDFNTDGKSMGEAGFNSAGVGMSSTETIYNGAKALKVDPYVTKTGIGEDSIENVILPRIHSAKEGVELLGKIIETQGASEGFGVAFVDNDGIWYLETGSGHQWMAEKVPADKYFVSANQGRLQHYLPNNPNYLASPTLVSFAEQHGLYQAVKGQPFDFHAAYSQDTPNDITYNYPRVWTLQHMYTQGLKTKIDQGKTFPVFLKPTHKLTVADVEQGLRNHYQGTSHDPYANKNPKEPYRPVSVFRTQESHVLQVRPNLPKAIGEVEYMAYGMTSLSVYLPYYQGMTKVPHSITLGTDQADDQSANWKFRKLQTLAMMDWNNFAPIVQKAYQNFEQQTAQKQKEMEKQYLAIYKSEPKQAQALINNFEQQTVTDALKLTDQLTNTLFTKLTHKVDMTYHFEGA